MRVRRVTRVLGVLCVAALATSLTLTRAVAVNGPTEAPTGFDGESNGFIMGPDFEEAKEEFTGPETEDDGLGPVFNGAGCGECHTTPVLGGTSQTVERRAGRFDGVNFFEHPGGSLIQDRALSPDLQETVQSNHNVIALRATISVLGDGFVEAISSNDLVANRDRQPRTRSPISCCTTSTPGTASCRTAAGVRATCSARRLSGAFVHVDASCMTC